MQFIPLTQGGVVIVDDEDFTYFNQWKWQRHRNGYATRRTTVEGVAKNILMHRAIMERHGYDIRGLQVDHKKNNHLDNRKSELRVATNTQNSFNRSKRVGSFTSQYKGVDWRPDRHKWRAKIGEGTRCRSLGHYVNEVDAALAYNAAASELYGEFAHLNSIEVIDVSA